MRPHDRLTSGLIFVLRFEAGAVGRASKRLDEAVERLEPDNPNPEADQLWDALHLILMHTANISKILWPQQKRNQPELLRRGKAVRELLSVPDSSPLKPRIVRNGFEHIDERLNLWLQEEKPGYVIDHIIGRDPLDAFNKDYYVLRGYDPKTGIVNVGRDTVELQPLVLATAAVGRAAFDWWRSASS